MKIISVKNACTSSMWESEEGMRNSKLGETLFKKKKTQTDRHRKKERKEYQCQTLEYSSVNRAGLACERPWFPFLAHSDRNLKKNSVGKEKLLVFKGPFSLLLAQGWLSLTHTFSVI